MRLGDVGLDDVVIGEEQPDPDVEEHQVHPLPRADSFSVVCLLRSKLCNASYVMQVM